LLKVKTLSVSNCMMTDSCHSTNFNAEINSRECIGQYKKAYPAILVMAGVQTSKGAYLGG
ncbi:hypothetical protein, partial [Planktotalea sp.]|uniref:hypothetical protein n=1 Tax=Planktotalea sp. TaxID=2029877 RepID=UPI0025F4685A